MKIVISPAKTLDFETPLPTATYTEPAFLDTTLKINRKLSKISRKKLAELMHISPKLAELNHQRYLDFQEEHNQQNARPALYAFAGDVYVGLDAYNIPVKKVEQAQEKLRILSGFYGILKPLDLIQPYRLEMGTDLPVGRKTNLYELWNERITNFLNQEMKQGEPLINLASNEYFKAINTKMLNKPIITPVFKDYKNGNLKIISFFAKKARGSMVRFVIDNNIEEPEDLRAFDVDGYRYSEPESGKEGQLVFIR